MEILRYYLELLSVSVELFLQKLWMRNLPTLESIGGPANGHVCIVTGPTSGIGWETAFALAQRGAHVILACRSLSRGQALKESIEAAAKSSGQAHPDVEVLQLDLSSLASIRRFSDAWKQRGRPLHILVNNAGIFSMSGPRSETEDGFEAHMGTNHLGHFLLTLLLLPSLRDTARQAGRPGRVVNVSSKLHFVGSLDTQDPQLLHRYSPLAAYSQSKLAQVLFAWELQRRTAGEVVSVAVHPGEVLTDVVRSLPGFLRYWYRLLMKAILLTPAQGKSFRVVLSGEADFIEINVYCATSPDLDRPKAQGLYYYNSNCTPIQPSKQARDPLLAAWLWDWSARQVGLPASANLPPAAEAADED
ncbi:hypothetical protein N2152v2_002144 [Parachlorella kessleri]